ncbi:MAG: pro-sigmaK processing inhibitor BofA family protein [Acetatifactor sp.]|nr:pro-sigmaK processing inhibitor BofA family protein [Acetatifactor sp.]
MVALVAICAIVLFIGVMKRKMEWLLNVLMRSILGTIAIYFVNGALAGVGISLGVGINPLTVLTSGILGFPGLVAIYGVGFYNYL